MWARSPRSACDSPRSARRRHLGAIGGGRRGEAKQARPSEARAAAASAHGASAASARRPSSREPCSTTFRSSLGRRRSRQDHTRTGGSMTRAGTGPPLPAAWARPPAYPTGRSARTAAGRLGVAVAASDRAVSPRADSDDRRGGARLPLGADGDAVRHRGPSRAPAHGAPLVRGARRGARSAGPTRNRRRRATSRATRARRSASRTACSITSCAA